MQNDLHLVMHTTPHGMWLPLIAFGTREEAIVFVASFAESKQEALKQGILGTKEGKVNLFGRDISLTSEFSIAKMASDVITPEEAYRELQRDGGVNAIG